MPSDLVGVQMDPKAFATGAERLLTDKALRRRLQAERPQEEVMRSNLARAPKSAQTRSEG